MNTARRAESVPRRYHVRKRIPSTSECISSSRCLRGSARPVALNQISGLTSGYRPRDSVHRSFRHRRARRARIRFASCSETAGDWCRRLWAIVDRRKRRSHCSWSDGLWCVPQRVYRCANEDFDVNAHVRCSRCASRAHRGDSVSSKARLQGANERCSEAGKHRAGLRDRTDSKNHVLGSSFEDHFKQLLARFRVIRERADGEGESPTRLLVAATKHHAVPAQRPESQVTNQDGDDSSCINRGTSRKNIDPPDIEMLPRHEGSPCPIEICLSAPDDSGNLNGMVFACSTRDAARRTGDW